MSKLEWETRGVEGSDTVRTFDFVFDGDGDEDDYGRWYVEGDEDTLHRHIVLFALHGYKVSSLKERFISESEWRRYHLGQYKQSFSYSTDPKIKEYNFPWLD